MNTLETYTRIITSEHQNKPKFMAMIRGVIGVLTRIQDLYASMIPLFDLGVAVGDQLDIIGQWVGISRNVNIPDAAGIYFEWDGDDYTTGWDFGSWAPAEAPSTIVSLPDDAYRNLIRAKIAANSWNGTIEGAYAAWAQVFPTYTILIQDNQNMTMAIGIVGAIVDSMTLALLTGGYLPLKPEGVRITEYFIPVDDGPLFAWDVESDYLGGWDEASWAREITT